MTTQLIIDGNQAVIPKNFSATVKRENSFFTKNGEYTYDCTLNLDNPVNCSLYGFLNRLNKSAQVETKRSAVLIADGHVYCRGTEIITRWTEKTVTIQIVSGESELNYFIGQDQKLDELDMGTIEDEDNEVVYPLIRAGDGLFVNCKKVEHQSGGGTFHRVEWDKQAPSPYLCVFINRMMTALGYTVGTNHLENTLFKKLFIVNTHRVETFQEMIPGWTVKDFLTEVEKLTGTVFVTNNTDPENPTCDIIQKTAYYQSAQQFTIHNVVDAYEAEVQDDDSRDAEFSTSDVDYDMPDSRWDKLMRLPEYMPAGVVTQEYESFNSLYQAAKSGNPDSSIIYKDTSTGRTYIKTCRSFDDNRLGTITSNFLLEVNQFAKIDREDTTSTLELKITPAPLMPTYYVRAGLEIIDLGSSDGYYEFHYDEAGSYEDEESEEESEPVNFEEAIREAEKKESSAGDLYCAFYNGTTRNSFPQIYTDAYHATMLALLYNYDRAYDHGTPEGSLRLVDLEAAYFQGGYEIDTKHAVTIETYDPNVIDPRQVYVIRNKRYVCKDVEENITADGRQKKWKGTFFPIHISDESLLQRWVLTHGVWDDHAAWLDDGRWNDDYDGAVV